MHVTRAAALHVRSGFVRNPQLAVARTRHGTQMVVDLSDWRHQEILADGMYEPHITALFARIAGPGWTVLDVGANVGYFAALASNLGGATATVHAFEPHPRMAAMAEINALMNDGVTYTVIRAACGARSDRSTLRLARISGNIGDSTMLTDATSTGPTSVVDVIRLDEHCRDHQLRPDLVKIDVEGFEQQVLEGMGNLLIERIPAHLVIEVGGDPPRPAASKITSHMADLGYEPRSITDAGHLVAHTPRAGLQDLCFVRRGAADN